MKNIGKNFYLWRYTKIALRPICRTTVALKRGWRLSDPVILALGAMLGLALGLILLRGFIFNPGLPSWQDLVWPYSSHVYPMHYLWDEFRQAPVLPNHMLGYWFFYQFPAETSIRLLYLFLFSMMGMSMFYAAFKLTVSRRQTTKVPLIIGVIGVVAFIVNPVVLRNWPIWYLLWFYAFMPLLLYVCYTAFSKIKTSSWLDVFKYASIIALILLIMSPGERLPFYIPLIPLAFLAAFGRPYLGYLKRSAVLTGLVLVLYGMFCAVWILPFAQGAYDPNEFYTFSRGILNARSGDANMYLAFNLMGIPSTYEARCFRISESLVPFRDAALLALPILAFGALLFRRSKLIIWLALSALFFIFMSKGTNPPLGGFYEWLACDSPVISSFGMAIRRPLYWAMPLMVCYALLFCFTLNYSFGWVRARLKWSIVKKISFIVIVTVFLAMPLFTSIPLLTGDVNGAFKPVQIGAHYSSMNRWLEEHDEDFKVMYYPRSFWFGSGKPTLPVGSRLEGSHMTMWYGLVRDSLPDTLRFGELVSPYNIRYVIFSPYQLNEEERPGVSALFEEQEDLVLVEEFGTIQVYESIANSSQIGVSTGAIAVQGGLENILSLNAIDSHDMLTQPIIFLDQSVASSDCLSGVDILISDQNNLDLYMTMLDEKHMIKTFEAIDDDSQTKWVKSRARPTAGAEWHFFLGSAGVDNWQHDYDMGFARASGGTLNMSFEVSTFGNYDIFIRCLRSGAGGALRVLLNGEPIGEVSTRSNTSEFEWVQVGTFDVDKGKHILTLNKHVSGFNAVNLIAILPVGELERYEAEMDALVADKRMVSIWEAETALNYSVANVSDKYAGEASNGKVLTMPSGSQAWRQIEVVRDGEYRIAVRFAGDALVSMDDQVVPVQSANLGFAYTDPVYLEKGVHNIGVIPSAGQIDLDVVWLYTVESENESVEDIFASDERAAQVVEFTKINPTKYRAVVNASRPFMLSFAESFENLWVATVNGKEYPSIPLNSVVNGFWIEDQGELEIIIEYKPQRYMYYGAIISLIGIIGALSFLIWEWRRRANVSSGAAHPRLFRWLHLKLAFLSAKIPRLVGR